jgi:DNA-directed RNA polymerase subunit RPC12/RpoP
MGQNFNKRCASCGKPGVETFDITEDGPEDDLNCPRCNDKLIEKSNERREWNYYHREGK